MNEKVLEVKMLGAFILMYDGKEIVLDRNVLSKTTQLLQILLLSGNEGISKTGLSDMLYGRDEVENINRSLNNTIFRLRRQLEAAGLPSDNNYINISSGMCTWDENIPVRIDALEFEKLAAQAEKEPDKEKRVRIYREACEKYSGEFLPNMIGEEWAAVRNVRYRDMYFHCVKELCEWLSEQEKYESGYKIAKAAATIYPFEDWQVVEIDFLISMGRYREAMDVYEHASRLIFDELGVSPSPEMLKRFRIMGEKVSEASGVIEDIKNRLCEKEKEKGAYYCSFPSFVDIYHVFGRMMERFGISVFLMLCTLKEGDIQADDKDKKTLETSKILSGSIRSSLRRGDFYTKYNSTQYLVMLLNINQENCKIVSDRITDDFKRNANRAYKIDFYVASIAEVLTTEDGKEKPKMSFRSRNTSLWE